MSTSPLKQITLLLACVIALTAPITAAAWTKDVMHSFQPVRDKTTVNLSRVADDAQNVNQAAYQAFAADPRRHNSVLVLTYHDVRPADPITGPDQTEQDRYTLTPEEFGAQLQMLQAAGFESVSTATLLRARQDPSVLPARPVMITFDDGTSGIWRYADPLLAQFGFRGVAFVITGRVDTRYPYYLTWDEVAALQDTDRWDIESHTHLGHDRVPVGAGPPAPFLINRIELSPGRLETLPEAQARVTADADQALAQFADHGLPRPQLFAYPFSAEKTPTNDLQFAESSREILAQRYPMLMTNLGAPHWASPADLTAGFVPRMEVTTPTDPRLLFDRILSGLPAGPPTGATPISAIG